MAKYTLELKQLIDEEINIFDFDYDLFDEEYKPILEQKIIDHYYFSEIGAETPARFLHNLKVKMREILVYYNPLYETTRLEQRILDNYDVTETMTRNTSLASATASTSKDVISDTPQSALGLTDYATSKVDGLGSGTVDNEGTEDWTRTMTGNIGVQTDADAVEKYRKTLINVDMMIIKDLSVLFMEVY